MTKKNVWESLLHVEEDRKRKKKKKKSTPSAFVGQVGLYSVYR